MTLLNKNIVSPRTAAHSYYLPEKTASLVLLVGLVVKNHLRDPHFLVFGSGRHFLANRQNVSGNTRHNDSAGRQTNVEIAVTIINKIETVNTV